ncbi:MAG: hypothetical protein V1872_10665 [bacterium]
MKKIKAVVIIGAILSFIVYSSLILAQTKKQKAKTPTTTTASKQRYEAINGKIISIDRNVDVIVVRMKKGNQQIERNVDVGYLSPKIISSLKKGDIVKITLKTGGKEAEKIEVIPSTTKSPVKSTPQGGKKKKSKI